MVIFVTMAQRTKLWCSRAQSPETRTFIDLKVQVRTEKLRLCHFHCSKSAILTVRYLTSVKFINALIYTVSADLLTTCDNPSNCSHSVCGPLLGDLDGLTCTTVLNNTFCPAPENGITPCTSMNLDYRRGYVRYACLKFEDLGLTPAISNYFLHDEALSL